MFKGQSLVNAIYERYSEVSDCIDCTQSQSNLTLNNETSSSPRPVADEDDDINNNNKSATPNSGHGSLKAASASVPVIRSTPLSSISNNETSNRLHHNHNHHHNNNNSNNSKDVSMFSSSPSSMNSASGISFYIPPAYSPRKTQSGLVITSCSLVMSDLCVTHIGDCEELERSCEHVLELDLAKNELRHWDEIKKLFMSLKQLRLLNLSHNPLNKLESIDKYDEENATRHHNTTTTTTTTSSSSGGGGGNDDEAENPVLSESELDSYREYFRNEWSKSMSFTSSSTCMDKLSILILNSCYIDLKVVQMALEHLSNLNELHLSSNNYSKVTFDVGAFSKASLKILYFNNNQLSSWNEVCKLGKCFPNLENLVLTHNNLRDFNPNDDEHNFTTSDCFKRLQILILNRVKLAEWSVIDRLRDFPSLRHVRIQNVPLLDEYTDEEKYFLLVAHLDDSMLSLNGSEITRDDKENCERKFIRHYMDMSERPSAGAVPNRYYELENKHGKLNKLADVNLEGNLTVEVKLKFRDKSAYEKINVRQTVGEFKKYLEKFTGFASSRLRVFYFDIEAIDILGPEELKYANRCLHSFNIRDGDEFEIDLKSDMASLRSSHHHHSHHNSGQHHHHHHHHHHHNNSHHHHHHHHHEHSSLAAKSSRKTPGGNTVDNSVVSGGGAESSHVKKTRSSAVNFTKKKPVRDKSSAEEDSDHDNDNDQQSHDEHDCLPLTPEEHSDNILIESNK